MNTRGIKLIIMLIFSLVLIPTVAGQLNVTFDNPLLPRVILNAPAGPSIPPLNGTFNQTLTDLLYWRLGAENDNLLSSDWDMDIFGFTFQNLLTSRIAACGNLGLCFTSAIVRLISSTQIMGDNVNNNISLRFVGDPFALNGTLRYDATSSQLNFDRNLTIAGSYFGNGSQLTDVCLIDLSNCMSFFNNTNVAYANNTNNFTENQNFDNNINLNGNLSSDDGVVKIANRVNISWDNQGLLSGCFTWDRDIIAESSSICSPVSSVLRLDSSVINLFGQTVNVGRGADAEECLGFVVSGSDGSFCFQSDSPSRFSTGIAQSAIEFSTWYGSSIPASFPNNISWNNVLAGELFMDVPIVRVRGGGLNVSTDVCIEGGNCLSFQEVNTDTNATTECSGDQVLLGNSSCETTTDFLGGGHTTSFYSMSTQKNSLLIPSIINPFASTNYSNYKYLNYSFSGLTYDSLVGLWTTSADGTFAMQVDWDGVFQSTTSEAKQIFLINGATQYERVFIVFQSTGAEEERHSAMVILTLNSGDTIEYKLESTQGACLPGCTVQTLNGTTMNIWQLA